MLASIHASRLGEAVMADNLSQYYLVQLSYTANAWFDLAEWARTTEKASAEERLGPVERLLKYFGGWIAKVDCDHNQIKGKFVGIGQDDLVAILGFPSHKQALGFKIAVAAEPGVKSIALNPLLPMEEAVHAMRDAGNARTSKETSYAAPGRRGSGP